MTNKYKISDLAKDFGLTSKDISALVLELTGAEKKSGATLNEHEIGLVFDALTKRNDYLNLFLAEYLLCVLLIEIHNAALFSEENAACL